MAGQARVRRAIDARGHRPGKRTRLNFINKLNAATV
jgi:hypothetical protein